jgi:predicted ribosomally synthesized peptide with nif11-like leader
MSAIEEFGEAVKASTDLQEKMKAAGSDLAKIVAVASGAGFNITEADLQAYADSKKGEMSDEDLEKVSGGAIVVTYVTVVAA